MTKPAALRQLRQISDALYLREFQKIQAALAAEAQAQQRLHQLDTQTAQATQDLEQGHALAQIGADVAWQSWADQTRQQLLHKLAHAKAVRMQEMDRVRTAFGRKEALRSLDESTRNYAKALRRQKQQENLLHDMLK